MVMCIVLFQVRTYLLAEFLYSLVCGVKTFNAIPYYRDKVYDPDPGKA